MSGSFPITPAHSSVSLKPCREYVTVRICAGRGRAHRYLIGFYRPNALNPACTNTVVVPKQIDGWGRTVEHGGPFSMLQLGPIFLRNAGTIARRICDLCRAKSTPGKCFSFIRALHQDPEKSLGIAEILSSPFHSAEPLFLGLVALSDGHRVGERKKHVRTETVQIRTKTG